MLDFRLPPGPAAAHLKDGLLHEYPAGWEWPNHVTDKLLFQGVATIAMARQVYGIRNPASKQLALFWAHCQGIVIAHGGEIRVTCRVMGITIL
jgi:hypothetical protein